MSVTLWHPQMIKLKKTFYPKKLRIKTVSDTINFGYWGLKICKNVVLSNLQLQCLNKILLKKLKKYGKFWIRAFPHFFITKKPLEVRMGNGKGNFFKWMVNLPKGFVLVEFNVNFIKNYLNINKLVKNLQSKIGVKIKIININGIR